MGRELENIDLTLAQRKEIAELLKRYLPDTEVWAYGSRVKFTAKPASDLDIVAFATKEQKLAIANLREAFDDSSLPFRVDLFAWDEVPKQFHKNIEAERVALQEKKEASALPEGWEEITLGDVIITNDATYSKKDKWEFINYLDTGNLTENQISYVQYLVVGEDKIPSRASRKVQEEDIVYSTVRPNQKHYGILKKPLQNLLVSTGFVTIRAQKECADTNFVYWFLVQPQIVEELQTIGEQSTSAYPSIKPSDIEGLKLNLPPLREQRAIAHILGSLDDKIELNRRMNETLEAMAQALFKSWFVDFDPVIDNALAAGNEIPEVFFEKGKVQRVKGEMQRVKGEMQRVKGEMQRVKGEMQRVKGEIACTGRGDNSLPLTSYHALFPAEFEHTEEMGWIPKGWRVEALDAIADFINGLACQKFPASENEVGLPVIKIKELSQGITKNSDLVTNNISQKYLIRNGDILFSWSGTLMTKLWCGGLGVLNQHVFKVVSDTYPKWFYYQWTDYHVHEFQKIASDKATTMGHIKRHHLSDAKTLIPCESLLEHMNRKMECWLKKQILLLEQIQDLLTLRDTLLPKLLSGEVRVSGAEGLIKNVKDEKLTKL